ncbi:hypothetical protein [Williamsia sp. DF01-3]|uniref:hypothetical protein n=1 Tax=Williamsia sp. DF01-3 TaxID=2934157 RepID=UPI001FF53C1C|nr:hypothetical protein [Williamsia sp. DF01-3]MCK0519594.1 hypothetical protein [Williamsia sp. DF01-3]
MYLPKRSGQPGRVFLIAAAILLVVAAAFAFWPVDNSQGTGCGSWALKDDSSAAAKDSEFNLGDTTKDLTRALADRYLGDNSANSLGLGDNTSQVQACESARGDQTNEVVIFGLAGAAALVVGLIRRYQPSRAT